MKYRLYDKQEQKFVKLGSGYEAPSLLITDDGIFLVEDYYHGTFKKKIDDERFIIEKDC